METFTSSTVFKAVAIGQMSHDPIHDLVPSRFVIRTKLPIKFQNSPQYVVWRKTFSIQFLGSRICVYIGWLEVRLQLTSKGSEFATYRCTFMKYAEWQTSRKNHFRGSWCDLWNALCVRIRSFSKGSAQRVNYSFMHGGPNKSKENTGPGWWRLGYDIARWAPILWKNAYSKVLNSIFAIIYLNRAFSSQPCYLLPAPCTLGLFVHSTEIDRTFRNTIYWKWVRASR